MAKETMIVFVYDTEYCKDETHDPINAVLYFHPSWVSDVQKIALCGQLMGTSQFLKHCFFRPKIIALQNGKFVFREFGRFVLAIGTDRNILDYLLDHRANLLASLVEFFHRDLKTIYDQFPPNKHHRNVSEKLYHIFGTYLPILQYNGNIFQNVPKLRIPKIASNIYLDAMHTLQNCQQTKGVLGGAILYHNKIVASQLSDNVTKNIVFTDPHRIKSTAEMITVNFHVPVGVQMIFVYIPVDHFNTLSADAYRSQTLQTQHLSNTALQSHVQKRKMKRDRSIIFSNIPEEHSCDQIDYIEQIQTNNKTKITLRPTNLPLKDVISTNTFEKDEIIEEKSNFPEYIGRPSVCSTPMTENKILHGDGIMSICANPILDVNTSKAMRSSFKIDFDKMFSKFVNNSANIERRNSFTDLQDSVKKISKKFSMKKTVSSYKMDSSSADSIRKETMLRATSDPTQSNSIDNDNKEGNIFEQFLSEYRRNSNIKTEEEAVEIAEDTLKCTQNPIELDVDQKCIKFETCEINKYEPHKNQELKTPFDKKSLSLPLKTHSDILADNLPARPLGFERKKMSGIQLTPLMAKLSVLAFSEERHGGYNRRDSLHCLDYATPVDEKCGNNINFQKDFPLTEMKEIANLFQKVELYICGQQNMTMFLLLENGSAQKQDIVQTMFDKCVAKLGKMESHLYQALNVNMLEGVSDGVYSLICVDSKWDTLLNHGPWTPLDQSFLEHMRTDLSRGQHITDIFLRTGESILYGYKSGRTEFFFKESAHYFTGIPPPSDPMGTIAKRAKCRLEEDFSIVLF